MARPGAGLAVYEKTMHPAAATAIAYLLLCSVTAYSKTLKWPGSGFSDLTLSEGLRVQRVLSELSEMGYNASSYGDLCEISEVGLQVTIIFSTSRLVWELSKKNVKKCPWRVPRAKGDVF